MKKRTRLMIAGLVAITTISIGSVAYAANIGIGSAGALADTEYTEEEMLVYAIQDEYAAQAEYTAIIEAYGSQVPYTNILKAENNHISRLTQLFTAYGYTVPDNKAETVLPASLEASYAIGVTAEENNIAMYEAFLKEELPADVKLVFENLLKASKNHLKAFQNAVDGNLTDCLGTGTMRNGQGRGNANCSGTGTGNANCNGTGTSGTGTGLRRGGMGRVN
jgi:hypothetical protein